MDVDEDDDERYLKMVVESTEVENQHFPNSMKQELKLIHEYYFDLKLIKNLENDSIDPIRNQCFYQIEKLFKVRRRTVSSASYICKWHLYTMSKNIVSLLFFFVYMYAEHHQAIYLPGIFGKMMMMKVMKWHEMTACGCVRTMCNAMQTPLGSNRVHGEREREK